MRKAQLLEALAKNNKTLSKKPVERMVTMTFSVLTKSFKNDGAAGYRGVGTFTGRTRKTRKGIKPRTGQAIPIQSSKTVRHKPAPALRRVL